MGPLNQAVIHLAKYDQNAINGKTKNYRLQSYTFIISCVKHIMALWDVDGN